MLRRTWKPNALDEEELFWGLLPSLASRRDMKRFRAPNMLAMVGVLEVVVSEVSRKWST